MEIVDFNVRHTGEHLLIGSLVKKVPGSRVVRVVHEESVDKAFIESEKPIEWDLVVDAAKEANRKIIEGHPIKVEYFDSLDDARKKYPSLRAYDERLIDKEKIRVVNIGGFDFSACKNPHVENTSQVWIILPLWVSSVRKGLYEVQFISGKLAIDRMLGDSSLIYKLSHLLGCSRYDVLKRVENILRREEISEEILRRYTRESLYNSNVSTGKVRYVLLVKDFLDMKHVMSIASKVMEDLELDILCVVSWDGEKNSIFIASKGVDIEDFKRRIKEVAGGSGGGRRGMYMGFIEDVEKFIEFFREWFG